MCDVDKEGDISYVALSYVWDNANLPWFSTENVNRFQEHGSLVEEMLLLTINDAIQMTKALAEKYIWIDCLFIMQDDEVNKLNFFPKMDLIFGFVLVVAASGVDPNASLPCEAKFTNLQTKTFWNQWHILPSNT